MTRRVGWVLGAMLFATKGMAIDMTYKGYETPSYAVTKQMDGFELRDYESHLVAEVTVEGSRDDVISAGFRELAGYIFGGNEEDMKITMTSPVMQSPTGEDWVVRFMMPTAYSIADLPKANSDGVQFTQSTSGRYAVAQFSGRATTVALNRELAVLEERIASAGLQMTGAPQFLFYDSPFTMPWNRRNEIAIPVQ